MRKEKNNYFIYLFIFFTEFYISNESGIKTFLK